MQACCISESVLEVTLSLDPAGTLPPSLATLQRLEVLDASTNRLTTALPTSWGTAGSFPALTSLILASNAIDGAAPFQPSVKRLLSYLFVRACMGGQVGARMCV